MHNDLAQLQDALRIFADERDWDQFHSPKNLASALSVESAELLEQFQWLTEEQSSSLTADKRLRVEEEIADVFLYLLRLSDKLQVDLVRSAWAKMESNARKYPVELARGHSRKYDEL